MNPDSRRLLVLAEGKFSPLRSKTANGAIAYLRDRVVAVIDSTKVGLTAQEVLGYGGDIPVIRSIQDGLAFKPTHLLIGIAPPGGVYRMDGWSHNRRRHRVGGKTRRHHHRLPSHPSRVRSDPEGVLDDA